MDIIAVDDWIIIVFFGGIWLYIILPLIVHRLHINEPSAYRPTKGKKLLPPPGRKK